MAKKYILSDKIYHTRGVQKRTSRALDEIFPDIRDGSSVVCEKGEFSFENGKWSRLVSSVIPIDKEVVLLFNFVCEIVSGGVFYKGCQVKSHGSNSLSKLIDIIVGNHKSSGCRPLEIEFVMDWGEDFTESNYTKHYYTYSDSDGLIEVYPEF